jgi:hypothetical protein
VVINCKKTYPNRKKKQNKDTNITERMNGNKKKKEKYYYFFVFNSSQNTFDVKEYKIRRWLKKEQK